MWVFLNTAFLSIVQDRDDPSRLLVRSRFAGDIERAFAALENLDVFEMADSDYRYRAFVPRQAVADRMAQAAQEVDYDNFKNSIREPKRVHAAHDIWEAWLEASER